MHKGFVHEIGKGIFIDMGAYNQQIQYPSMKACSAGEGVDVAILKMAKDGNAPGFNATSAAINWTLLKPWLDQHIEDLKKNINDNIGYFKKESAKRDVILKDLEIQKKKGDYLEPQDVMGFLKKVSVAQNALFVGRMKELAPKLVGKTENEIRGKLEEMTIEVCNIFSKGLSTWNK